MKWVVAFASGAGAWAVWQTSKAWMPLAVLLVASGGVEFFGRMRREEWVPFSWASLVLLTTCAVICFLHAHKQQAAGASQNP